MNEFLPDEIIVIHRALVGAAIPHAFGGAIALAYWAVPRYTHDIDLNIALPARQHRRVLDTLAGVFALSDRRRSEQEIANIAQTRLLWDSLPVDLFFANTPFHKAMARRRRSVDYMGTQIDVLSPEDLVLCKVLFNRTKDWLDIENIVGVQQHLDERYLGRWLHAFFDTSDVQLTRVEELLRQKHGPSDTGAW